MISVVMPLTALFVALLGASDEPAADRPAGPDQKLVNVSFHDGIWPILRDKCQGCHQPAKAKGGVVLTSHASILAGDEDGEPLIDLGQPDRSLLVEVLMPYEGEPPDMPREKPPLSSAEVETILAWIQAGADDDTPPGQQDPVSPDNPPEYVGPPVVTSIDHSPDGNLLAVSGYHEVLLFRSADLGLEARLIGLSERIESAIFSPDGKTLAVVGGSPGRLGEVQFWSMKSHKLRMSVVVGHDTLYGASWSGDGSLLAFGCPGDNTVRALDAKNGEQVLYQGAHEDWVLGTTFSSDNSHLVSVSRDRSMKLIQVAEQQFIDNITSITPGVLKGGLMTVDRHPERDELLIGGADGIAKLYRMYREKKRVIGDDYNLLRALPAVPGRIFAARYSPDGSVCGVASSDHPTGAVHLFQEADGALLWERSLPHGQYALDFHPDGSRIAVGGQGGSVRILAVADGAVLAETEVLPDKGRDSAKTVRQERSAQADPATADQNEVAK